MVGVRRTGKRISLEVAKFLGLPFKFWFTRVLRFVPTDDGYDVQQFHNGRWKSIRENWLEFYLFLANHPNPPELWEIVDDEET